MVVNVKKKHKHPPRAAERNALDYCSEKPKGGIIYVSGRPCFDCMNDIVAAGIHKVIYFDYASDKGSMLAKEEDWEISKKIAKLASITLIPFAGNLNWMRDWSQILYNKGVFD